MSKQITETKQAETIIMTYEDATSHDLPEIKALLPAEKKKQIAFLENHLDKGIALGEEALAIAHGSLNDPAVIGRLNDASKSKGKPISSYTAKILAGMNAWNASDNLKRIFGEFADSPQKALFFNSFWGLAALNYCKGIGRETAFTDAKEALTLEQMRDLYNCALESAKMDKKALKADRHDRRWLEHIPEIAKDDEPETGKPETGTGKPETGTGKPETGTGKPETGTGKPETGTGKPETGTGKPETGTGKPTIPENYRENGGLGLREDDPLRQMIHAEDVLLAQHAEMQHARAALTRFLKVSRPLNKAGLDKLSKMLDKFKA